MDILVKHLGINTPPDLTQGESFNKGIHQFSLESKYSLLQDGSPSSLMSSIETMKGNDTTTLSKYDTEFKQLLSEYTGLLNTVNREILQEQQKYGPMSDYLGKRLKTNSHDTYINEYGYARNIPLSDVVDSSCPQSSDSFNNTCQGLSDAYGVTYSENYKTYDTLAENYNAICKKANPGNKTVMAVKTPCVPHGCEGAGYPGLGDMCNAPTNDWTCCAGDKITTPCKDLDPGYQKIKNNGGCSDKNPQHDSWRRRCPKTCGYCDDPKYNPDKKAQIEKIRGNAEKNRANSVTDATNFGCAPDYAKEWWKHHSCKTKPSSSKHPGCDIASMNTAIFKKGPDMKPGEPCHLAGKNIRNSKTNQVAWVDLTGVKHAYPNSKMRDNLIGCNNKVTVTLDDAKFSNVPTGSPMTNDGICLNISINEQDYTKLLKMNKQLQVLAAKIVNELDTLISKDSETETEIRTKKSSIHAFLKNLKKERKNFDQNKHLIKTMQYQSEDSHVSYVSNKYHMIAWGLLVVGVGGFTIHQLSTRTSL